MCRPSTHVRNKRNEEIGSVLSQLERPPSSSPKDATGKPRRRLLGPCPWVSHPRKLRTALTSVETPGAITRREALKRTGALLAAGRAWSFVRLPVGHVTSPTQSSPASSASTPTMLEGLVMQVAASEPAYYDLLTLSQSGLSSALGSFCGASVVINGQVFRLSI